MRTQDLSMFMFCFAAIVALATMIFFSSQYEDEQAVKILAACERKDPVVIENMVYIHFKCPKGDEFVSLDRVNRLRPAI